MNLITRNNWSDKNVKNSDYFRSYNIIYNILEVGDHWSNSILSIPKVNRGSLDNQNINGIVIDIRNPVYQDGTLVGIIQFVGVPKRNLTM